MSRTRLLLSIALLAVPQLAAAQDGGRAAAFDGVEVFGLFLRVAGLEPLKRPADLTSPEKTLLVVFGDLRPLDELPGGSKNRLKEFLARGGAALLASDRSDDQRLSFLNLSITGHEVLQDARTAYHHLERCPQLRLRRDTPPALLSRLSAEQRLAANGPSGISIKKKLALDIVAEFADDCRYGAGGRGAPDIFAVSSPAGALPGGRIVVLAGQGVFFNSMLLAPDNNNFQFAWNCVGWLKEGPSGPRSQVLFFHHGQVVSSLALPPSISASPKMPPIPATVLANRLLRHIEEQKVLQSILEDNFGLARILQSMLLWASAVLLFYGSWRLARGMLRVEWAVPLLIETAAATGLARTPLEVRHEALAGLGNYAEPAQGLARQWFWDHVDIEPLAWDEPGFRFPEGTVQGSWLTRWRLNRQVRWLRNLARTAGPAISAKHFQQIPKAMQRLSGAVREGQLTWQ